MRDELFWDLFGWAVQLCLALAILTILWRRR